MQSSGPFGSVCKHLHNPRIDQHILFIGACDLYLGVGRAIRHQLAPSLNCPTFGQPAPTDLLLVENEIRVRGMQLEHHRMRPHYLLRQADLELCLLLCPGVRADSLVGMQLDQPVLAHLVTVLVLV